MFDKPINLFTPETTKRSAVRSKPGTRGKTAVISVRDYFVMAAGAVAVVQGAPVATARSYAPAPKPIAPTPAPESPAPAMGIFGAVASRNPGVPPSGPVLATVASPQASATVASPQASAIYEQCTYKISNDKYACLQGLPLDAVQGLEPSYNGITCDDFINILWSGENYQALQAGQATTNYSQAILFEIPDNSECCAVYESSNPRGCLNLYPEQAACNFTDRSCVAFGYPSMKDIVANVSPPAIGGAGVCESSGATGEIECITKANVLIPAQESTGGSGGGSSVQVTSGCSVNSATGVLTGTCTVNPTDALG